MMTLVLAWMELPFVGEINELPAMKAKAGRDCGESHGNWQRHPRHASLEACWELESCHFFLLMPPVRC